MTRYGYVRWMPDEPEPAVAGVPVDGVELLFTDLAEPVAVDWGGLPRPGWVELCEQLQPGDAVWVPELAHIGWDIEGVISGLSVLSAAFVDLWSDRDAGTVLSSAGVLNGPLLISALHRAMVRLSGHRTHAGKAASSPRPSPRGRPRKMDEARRALAEEALRAGATLTAAAAAAGVHPSTLRRSGLTAVSPGDDIGDNVTG